jgi:ABC-type multidrug transport system fused ATPase/permease subunit
VLPYLRPYSRLAASSGVITVLAAVVGLLAPWPLKILIDNVLEDHPLPSILGSLLGSLGEHRLALMILAVLAGFGITLLESGLNVLNNYVHTKLEQRIILDFRSDLFQHVQRLSLAFHDQRRTGDFMARINYQSAAIGGVAMLIPPLAQSGITLVGMFWVAFTIDRQLALLSLTVVPFLYYSIGYYTKRIEPRVRQVGGMEGQALSIVHEAMSMLRVIVAFGREGYEYRRFREQGESAVDARVKLTVRQTVFSMVVNATTAAGTALVLGVGAYHVLQGTLTVGQLLVVMAYIASVYSPLQAISATIGSAQQQLVFLQRALELLDTEPEIKDAPGAITVQRANGDVTFEGVSFSYQRRANTLRDISFKVAAGQVIAFVGPTGAGKTTLISLIPRFYDPQQGRVLLDGVDSRQLTLKSLRQQISIVLQEPLLFSGSIADNIRYGRLDAGMDDIVEAARGANAHDFIGRLPKKYETELGERGAQLSGGERQRIAVARAFLKDAPILILDEPTSSIDSRTEAVILDALDRLMRGRTTFVIAHRLSTIRNADVIIVLNHGQLVEQGAHEELLQRAGLYRQLWDAQTRQAQRKTQAAAAPPATAGGHQP